RRGAARFGRKDAARRNGPPPAGRLRRAVPAVAFFEIRLIYIPFPTTSSFRKNVTTDSLGTRTSRMIGMHRDEKRRKSPEEASKIPSILSILVQKSIRGR